MALIVLSKKYFDTNGGGDLGFIVNSIDGVNFSLEKDCVFVEGDIMRNIVFVGQVDSSFF